MSASIMIPKFLRDVRTVPQIIPIDLEIIDETAATPSLYPEVEQVPISSTSIRESQIPVDSIMIPTLLRLSKVTEVTISEDEEPLIEGALTPALYPDLAAGLDDEIDLNLTPLERDSIMIPTLVRAPRVTPEIIQTVPVVNTITVKNTPLGDFPEIHVIGPEEDIDIELVPKGKGSLSVAGTVDYENYVTEDDDIPNKKWIENQGFIKDEDCCTPPSSLVINREGDSISSFTFANGKVVTINRVGGMIQSIDDGIYLKSIVRVDNQISEVVVSEI